MKKLVTLFAAAAMAVTVSAQTVTESKAFDNIYVGVNGGVATYTTGNRWMSNLMPNFGVRVGRYFTPVFGLAVEGNAYLKNRIRHNTPIPFNKTNRVGYWQNSTTIKSTNVSLLGTVNLCNLFAGYKGEPRTFEVTALYGLGWEHTFGTAPEVERQGVPAGVGAKQHWNRMTSKAGLDFALNLGKAKAVQVYLEPSITWAFNHERDVNEPTYNIHNSFVQLNAGVVYKFKNSNGTHNFTIAQLRDQAEIDALNATINDLRNRKPEVREVVKEVVKEVPAAAKVVSVENMVFVTFAQGKSALTAEAKKALDEVKSGAHVDIVGTASPEGSKAINDKLSQARADVVANYLKGRGVVVDKAKGEGVKGVTSNRLAIVYVK